MDLRRDPPPDIVVEIDVFHGALFKLDFYARLDVPEIWRYDEKRLYMLRLTDDHYEEVATSLAFLLLTSEILTRVLERNQTADQSAARKAFRQWLRTQLPERI